MLPWYVVWIGLSTMNEFFNGFVAPLSTVNNQLCQYPEHNVLGIRIRTLLEGTKMTVNQTNNEEVSTNVISTSVINYKL